MKYVSIKGARKARLKSVKSLNLNALAKAAQKVYDDWEQDEEGYSEEYGTGGICQDIASEIADKLNDKGIDCTTVSAQMGEQHVWIVGKFKEGIYEIDIYPQTYERGGGYTWKKVPKVKFSRSDLIVDMLSPDPKDFDDYCEN